MNIKNLRDGDPCHHSGCLHHISHPCEVCGRIGGIRTNDPDTITLKRIYSTHCQVCGEPFSLSNIHMSMPKLHIVYFVPLDNNITCFRCARESGLGYEARIYKEG